MITGINHINLAVRDIPTSFTFYKDVLGFMPLCKSEGSAYLLAGDLDSAGSVWISLDLDREKLHQPSPCNTHLAFSVKHENFEKLCQAIIHSGAKVFKENTSPQDSLYFLDPDGHKLEIHVGNWRERIEYRKQDPGVWKNVEWYV